MVVLKGFPPSNTICCTTSFRKENKPKSDSVKVAWKELGRGMPICKTSCRIVMPEREEFTEDTTDPELEFFVGDDGKFYINDPTII